MNRTWLFVFVLMASTVAQAMYTELGISYNYKTLTFDQNDNIQSQGITASVAFYVWEQVALEAAYTNGLLVKKELNAPLPAAVSIRTTIQTSDIYEFNVQYLFYSDRKAIWQPYIKAGIAYIVKNQQVQVDQNTPFYASPPPGWGPSVGIGLRIFVTESMSVRLSYDVVQTPIDAGNTAYDVTGRAGISWLF